MQDTPRHEAYEAGSEKFSERGASSRTPPEGTVARGFLREDSYLYTGKREGAAATTGGSPATAAAGTTAGAQQTAGTVNVRGSVVGGAAGAQATAAATTGGPDVFPFPVTEAVIRRGQEQYNVFCAMCHGMTGEGDGMIVRRGFRKPPSYFEDRLRENASSASHFFDVITNGWGAMPAYDYMVPAEDRWAIIAYIRALQLSRSLRADDLSPEERAKMAGDAQKPHDPGARGTQTHDRPRGGGEDH